MSHVPAAELAVIDERKITDYLLARRHPLGWAKAAYFESFGFRREHWQALRDALATHLQESPVVESTVTPFGQKYMIEGPMRTLDGRQPMLRAVWFVEAGQLAPRFVTAYPAPGDRG